MKNFKFANDYIAQNNLQNTLQAIAIKEFAICLDSQIINKPVQTTKEQPTHNIIKHTDKIIDVHYLETQTQINFEGFSLHLKHDGTFYFTDVVG